MKPEIFFDANGTEIKEFDLVKVFHFVGARRKVHFMYKWIRLKDGHLCGMHLDENEQKCFKSSFWLKACPQDEHGNLCDFEILQGNDLDKRLKKDKPIERARRTKTARPEAMVENEAFIDL